MARLNTIPIRRAVLTIAKADTDLVAIVEAKDIYPQTVGVRHGWPFIRSGAPASVPLRAACVDGVVADFAMHGFAKDRMDGTKRVETAEDYAGRLGAALAAALDGQRFTIPGGSARILWTGDQLLMDPDEPGCFHTVQNFQVRALTS
jgi:hypothetical protein